MYKWSQHFINEIFNAVAPKYDLMNDLMSIGSHRLWKRHFILRIIQRLEWIYTEQCYSQLGSSYPESEQASEHRQTDLGSRIQLLDVATGTCDIPVMLHQALKSGALKRFLKNHINAYIADNVFDINLELRSHIRDALSIVCTDINPDMLAAGKAKLCDNNLINNIATQLADAANLPFTDSSFDIYTIVFGIRNVTDKEQGLREAYRVLSRGGYFMCMEFGKPDWWLKKAYHHYSNQVIPRLGSLIGQQESYQYLVDSISSFPSAPVFTSMIKQAGFTDITYEKLYGGIVNIYYARK